MDLVWVLAAGAVAVVPPVWVVRWFLSRLRLGAPVSSSGAGRWIGMLELVLIFGLVVAGEAVGAGLVATAKTILRFPEITGDDPPLEAEYVLVGSLASWSIAVVIALVVRHLVLA